MITVEEIYEMIVLLEKEKRWILTLIAFHGENADVLERIIQPNCKNKINMVVLINPIILY